MSHLRIPLAAVAAAVLALGACASSGSRVTEGRQMDVISRAEIVESGAGNAYEAVERLRPQFLRPRGGASIREGGQQRPPQVFVDGLELGGPDVLLDIPASTIVEIRYERNRDTEVRLGSGQYGGVIHVRTSRSGQG